jgi:hypothetical protein
MLVADPYAWPRNGTAPARPEIAAALQPGAGGPLPTPPKNHDRLAASGDPALSRRRGNVSRWRLAGQESHALATNVLTETSAGHSRNRSNPDVPETST